MNIFDILDNNNRVIVFSSKAYECIYTWDYRTTIQRFEHRYSNSSRWEYWVAADIYTVDYTVDGTAQARYIARNWHDTLSQPLEFEWRGSEVTD